MLKRYLCLLFMIFLITFVGCSEQIITTRDGEFFGQVKSVLGESAEIIKKDRKYIEGKYEETLNKTYDQSGNILESKELTEDEEGMKWWECTSYKYNKKGNVIEEIFTSDGTRFGKTIYIYDKNDRVTEILNYGTDDTTPQKTVNTYDSKGILNKSLQYDGNNELWTTTTYISNSQGKIEEVRYSNGVLRDRTEYDIRGFRIKMYNFDAYENKRNWVFINDNKGNVIQVNYSQTNKTYKENNYNVAYKYEYKFDSYGNWIKETEYIRKKIKDPFKPINVTNRKISYFN